MLRLAVASEVPAFGMQHRAEIEIAIGDDKLVAQRLTLRNNFAGRGDDAAFADQIAALLFARLGDGDDPGPVLICARLQNQMIVEVGHAIQVWRGREIAWRVVAEHNQLDALHAHDAVGLRPAAVIADTHADDTIVGLEHGETEIAGFEITFLEMLKGALRIYADLSPVLIRP